MNKNHFINVLAILLLTTLATMTKLNAQIRYVDANQFSLFGKISDSTETRYERLPYNLKNVSRNDIWYLGKNTPGLYLKFITNSKKISIRWESLNDFSMAHMTKVGTAGFDLYCFKNNHWQFVNSFFPTGRISSYTVMANIDNSNQEYMLNFPLYDGIAKIEIGIDSLSTITNSKLKFPQNDHPIVAYGTSITQGGCASRPGMAWTNILTRHLNRTVINLGFSGNARLDFEIANLMTQIESSLYILDFLPNVNEKIVNEKAYQFIEILSKKKPNTPILIIDCPLLPQSEYDTTMKDDILTKNKAILKIFNKLKSQGNKNIYFISTKKFIITDNEGTVDGIHFTDLGHYRFEQEIESIIKSIIK